MAEKKTTAPRGTTRDPSVSLSIQAPPDDAPVVALDGDIPVWMPPARAQGIRAFGDLVPGTVYRVSAKEAHRLVAIKGFRFADAAAQSAVCDWIDGIADAHTAAEQE